MPAKTGRCWFESNRGGYEMNKDFDNPFVTMTNMQIVNGCQTSATLAKVAKEVGRLLRELGELHAGSWVNLDQPDAPR